MQSLHGEGIPMGKFGEDRQSRDAILADRRRSSIKEQHSSKHDAHHSVTRANWTTERKANAQNASRAPTQGLDRKQPPRNSLAPLASGRAEGDSNSRNQERGKLAAEIQLKNCLASALCDSHD